MTSPTIEQKRAHCRYLAETLDDPSPEAQAILDDGIARINANPGWGAIVDQGLAAAHEQRAVLEGYVDDHTETSVIEEVPTWVRVGANAAVMYLAYDVHDSCIHNVNIRRPQPYFAVAWNPYAVFCAACTPDFKAVGIEEYRCDGCQLIFDGDEFLMQGGYQVGPLLWFFGACRACVARP